MSAPLTVMLPLNRCARTWAGREGSPRGTLMRLSDEVSAGKSCAPSIRVARTAKMNCVYSIGRFIYLFIGVQGRVYLHSDCLVSFPAPRHRPGLRYSDRCEKRTCHHGVLQLPPSSAA